MNKTQFFSSTTIAAIDGILFPGTPSTASGIVPENNGAMFFHDG